MLYLNCSMKFATVLGLKNSIKFSDKKANRIMHKQIFIKSPVNDKSFDTQLFCNSQYFEKNVQNRFFIAICLLVFFN